MDQFAIRISIKRSLQKVFQGFKTHAFKKTVLAREMCRLFLTRRVFGHLIKGTRRKIKQKRINKQIVDIYKLFQSKKVFKAWKHQVFQSAKIHAIGEKKFAHNFCVKYSQYCQCSRCEAVRRGLLKEEEVKKEEVILLTPPSLEQNTQCLPFNMLYADESKKCIDDQNEATIDTRGDTALGFLKSQNHQMSMSPFNSIMSGQSQFKDPLNAPLLRETLKKKITKF